MTQSLSLATPRYSVQPRDQIFVKDCDFSSFTKNASKPLGQNTSKNLSSKCNLNLLYHTKEPVIDPPKKRFKKKTTIQKTAEAIGDLLSNEITSLKKFTRE